MHRSLTLSLAVLSLSAALAAQTSASLTLDFESFATGASLAQVNAVTTPLGATFDGAFPGSMQVVADASTGSNQAIRGQTLPSASDILINLSQTASYVRVRWVADPPGSSSAALVAYSQTRTPTMIGGPDVITTVSGTHPTTLAVRGCGIRAIQIELSNGYVVVDDIHIEWEQPGSSTSYGPAKIGTNGVPTLTSNQPILGTTLTLSAGNGRPGAVPLLLLGPAPAQVPFDGGAVLVFNPVIVVMLPFDSAGSSQLPISLPGAPSFCNLKEYGQVMFIDPGNPGALQSAQTAGLELVFGD